MRHNILIFILVITSLNLFAQRDWDPINPSYTYHLSRYPNYFPNPIAVDSIEVLNNDTIYYLNRSAGKCDTCTSYINYISNNISKILQRKCVIRDSLWIFCDPDTFYYKPYAKIGESWIIDSNNMTIATVDQIYIDTIMGVADSVKSIRIGQYDRTILSKHHGFIRFYDLILDDDYDLIGIPELNLGIHSLTYKEAYNFEVGDLFYYEHKAFKKDLFSYVRLTRREILQKSISGDTIFYKVKDTYKNVDFHSIPFDTIRSQQIHTINYVDSANHPLNCRTGELCHSIFSSNYYQSLNKRTNTANLGYEFASSTSTGLYTHFQDDIFAQSNDMIMWEKWEKGIGIKTIGYSCLDSADRIDLLARSTDAGSYGNIPTESELLPISNNSEENNIFSVYPNPNSGKFTIDLENLQALEVRVINNLGKEIVSVQDVKQYTFDLNLSSGVYFVYVQFGNTYKVVKFVVR